MEVILLLSEKFTCDNDINNFSPRNKYEYFRNSLNFEFERRNINFNDVCFHIQKNDEMSKKIITNNSLRIKLFETLDDLDEYTSKKDNVLLISFFDYKDNIINKFINTYSKSGNKFAIFYI